MKQQQHVLLNNFKNYLLLYSHYLNRHVAYTSY